MKLKGEVVWGKISFPPHKYYISCIILFCFVRVLDFCVNYYFFFTKLMACVPPGMSIALALQLISGPSMGRWTAMDLQTAM